jgi:hypothetical protein
MLHAVKLDREFQLSTVKVENVSLERMLATPFQSAESPSAQPVQNTIFSSRRRSPHAARVIQQLRSRLHGTNALGVLCFYGR